MLLRAACALLGGPCDVDRGARALLGHPHPRLGGGEAQLQARFDPLLAGRALVGFACGELRRPRGRPLVGFAGGALLGLAGGSLAGFAGGELLCLARCALVGLAGGERLGLASGGRLAGRALLGFAGGRGLAGGALLARPRRGLGEALLERRGALGEPLATVRGGRGAIGSACGGALDGASETGSAVDAISPVR